MCYLLFYEDLAKVDFRGGKAARLDYPEPACRGGRLPPHCRITFHSKADTGLSYSQAEVCVFTHSRIVSFTRVCQPRPVARNAARTSGSKRNLTATLASALTLPTGRPRRAMICLGVCTAANSPRLACPMDSSRPRSNSVSSSSILFAPLYSHRTPQKCSR